MRSNKLRDMPEVLRRITSLTRLDMADNEVCELPAWVGEFESLKTLDLSRNRLRTLPEHLQACSTLKRLRVQDNLVQDMPQCIQGMRALEYLDMQGNPLRNDLPPWLQSPKHAQLQIVLTIGGMHGPPRKHPLLRALAARVGGGQDDADGGGALWAHLFASRHIAAWPRTSSAAAASASCDRSGVCSEHLYCFLSLSPCLHTQDTLPEKEGDADRRQDDRESAAYDSAAQERRVCVLSGLSPDCVAQGLSGSCVPDARHESCVPDARHSCVPHARHEGVLPSSFSLPSPRHAAHNPISPGADRTSTHHVLEAREVKQVWVVTMHREAEQMDLSGAMLDKLPESMVHLNRLSRLNLDANLLSDLPDFLSHLDALQEVSCEKNRLTQMPAVLRWLSRLVQVSVADNAITHLPEWTSHLVSLKSLNLEVSPRLPMLLPCASLYLSLTLSRSLSVSYKPFSPTVNLLLSRAPSLDLPRWDSHSYSLAWCCFCVVLRLS